MKREIMECVDTQSGTVDKFYVEEKTTLNEIEYYLVTEIEDDSIAHIFKRTSAEDSEEMSFDEVEDDNELDILARVFEELMDDTGIEG